MIHMIPSYHPNKNHPVIKGYPHDELAAKLWKQLIAVAPHSNAGIGHPLVNQFM